MKQSGTDWQAIWAEQRDTELEPKWSSGPDHHFVVRWREFGKGVEPQRVRPTQERPEMETMTQ